MWEMICSHLKSQQDPHPGLLPRGLVLNLGVVRENHRELEKKKGIRKNVFMPTHSPKVPILLLSNANAPL